VIVMAVRNRNRVHFDLSRLAEERQAVAALAFRVHSRVEQNAVIVNLDQPRARADVRVGIQICDVHENNLTTDGRGGTQIKNAE